MGDGSLHHHGRARSPQTNRVQRCSPATGPGLLGPGVVCVIEVEHAGDLASRVGQELGSSNWRGLTLQDFAAYGRMTGEDGWVHTDPDRAAKEMPFGGVIAQGFLLLGLLTAMSHEIFEIRGKQGFLNYGLDRVRFTNVVVSGMRVRLRATLADLVPQKNGRTIIKLACTLEAEGQTRPAIVADWILLAL